MKKVIKHLLNFLSLILVTPLSLPSLLEQNVTPSSERLFSFGAQLLALIPGFPGILLRRAYYRCTVEQCSLHCVIGFGTIIGHRRTVIESQVAIGSYCVVGSSRIGKGCEIGSRVSITSGRTQHKQRPDGTWTPFTPSQAGQLCIGENVWIGEGAIVMADIGSSSLVGAGAVVVGPVDRRTVVAGNPARTLNSNQKD